MKKSDKNADIFLCEPCQFRSDKLSEWNRHLTTQKTFRSDK